jgi:Cu-Zn family superoxide dismutase
MNNKLLIPLCAATVLLTACGRQDAPPAGTSDQATATPSTPPVTASDAAVVEASAQLAATQGHTASGVLAVSAMGDGVHLSGNLLNLPPNGEFGFHIHEKGDCSAPDASSAGPHFNPTSAEHGNPQGDAHHSGDMLNLKSDAQGVANVDVHVSGVTLSSGQPNDVFGRAVVLHEKADDYASQPAGNSGARIACGVISNAPM